MKRCPFCAEDIEDAAVVCRACKRSLAETLDGSSRPPWGIPLAVAGALLSVASGGLGMLGTVLLWIGLVGAIAKGHILVRLAGGLVLAVLIATTISDLTGSPARAPTMPDPGAGEAARAEPASPADPVLAIVSSRSYEERGYHVVEGQVVNLTARPLERVTAVATWYTQDGTSVTGDTALIEKDPILPGQTSPFRAGIRSNLPMDTFSVQFKHLGETVATRDDSKQN
jgi:hypothetical protein